MEIYTYDDNKVSEFYDKLEKCDWPDDSSGIFEVYQTFFPGFYTAYTSERVEGNSWEDIVKEIDDDGHFAIDLYKASLDMKEHLVEFISKKTKKTDECVEQMVCNLLSSF